ncbi:hypothetical protein O4J56_24460 [Nocardiopsis sp. RSe5-2]|uniref:Secreted protein n=1 Tax=Nocardiopsis endophytica TaxID=3018445 RepID=A0ABT4UA28_9ACTN|nr:hypothetical protein [Nocardiopsis endophytica]MDA2813821.1 hypothetical protein [Nocardiopsis endophytica]
MTPVALPRIRAAAVLGALPLAAAGLFTAPASAAPAQDVDLVCTTTFQFDFTPALDFNTVDADGVATIASCRTPNGSQPDLQSAQVVSTPGTEAAGCSPAPLNIDGGATIEWNTGRTSQVDFVISTDPETGDLGLTADIIRGVMAGGTITAVPVIATQDGLCGADGVRSFTANAAALTFTK